MIEPLEGMDRGEHRKLMHMLWERSKTGDFEGLDDEQRRLAQAMKLHEDEFHNEFEFADVIQNREYDPDQDEVNPFLHITMHAAVETQIENKDPIEVYQFYNAMAKKKCSRHETVHLIAAIMTPLMYRTMTRMMPFDNNRYISLLKKYKNAKK